MGAGGEEGSGSADGGERDGVVIAAVVGIGYAGRFVVGANDGWEFAGQVELGALGEQP